MDLLKLSSYLQDLLIDNDRVSLFGIGSFVAENSSAFFSGDGKTIFPPSRKLTFKASESWDDGMIAYLHQRQTGRSLAEAQQEVKVFAEQLELELRTQKSLLIPGIGELKATKEGNLFFVVDLGLDICTEGVGLQAVPLKELDQKRAAVRERARQMQEMLEKEQGTDTVDKTDPIDEVVKQEQHPSRRGLWMLLVLIFLVILLALMWYWPTLEQLFDGWLYSEEELRLINSHH